MSTTKPRLLSTISVAVLASLAAAAPPGRGELKPFDEVSKDHEKVISTADGAASLYGVYVDRKRHQVLAELPRGFAGQKHYIAVTQAGGGTFAGLQGPSRYVYWRRYDNRIALLEPELGTRSTGETESRRSVERLFTDRVLIDVPIVATGPSGQPVIDLDDLLVKNAGKFAGSVASGVNTRLARVVKAKAFPKNIEIAFEMPVGGGKLVTLHYSISLIPDKTGYEPRVADERVGYFTTVYRDLGEYRDDDKWVRRIDRWHLEKRDPSLTLSPPKQPIVYYLEHTIPVRYRRWVRQGVLYWNEAFEQVGLDRAIEVYVQDERTGAHMDKDPEDVRFNFVRWLNNDVSTAIGPHRSHPITGQILDADIVLTDGWIRAYWGWYHEQMPDLGVSGFGGETLAWLEGHPQWDPRILLAPPERRPELLARHRARVAAGPIEYPNDPILVEDDDYAVISEWLGSEQRICLAAHGLAFDMAAARLQFEAFEGEAPEDDPGDELDGIPEWFIGPLLAELTCHEVGHTLGLRHNFKASSVHALEDINSEAWKGERPLAGSVMDYLPPNFNMESGEIQGDITMIGLGPYDLWAIEYGYTFDDPAAVAQRAAEPELAFLTDDDTGGPDPLARRYDFSADPLDYAENQMRIVRYHRERILSDFVKDGESWSKARRGYTVTLGMQTRALSMVAGWVGGAHVHRDRKGDPGGRRPIEVVDPEQQRRALRFLVDNAFNEDVFALTPELLAHMTVDKWSDRSRGDRGESAWPVHDRIMGVQASVLTMVLNPTTLRRVHDNELRTPADGDALTLPEVFRTLNTAVFAELEAEGRGAAFTDRRPMISSLRRNLQSAMADRLIALAGDVSRMPRPVRTLARQHLRDLRDLLDARLEGGEMDAYTQAHLADLRERIGKALDAVYVNEM
ncbi:MAG: zinc-dependent metalloprotease [Planctomycetota bacterium]|jgi:hypothetical protein